MEKIQKSIEVDRPIRSVYNQWTHFEEFPRFIEGVKQVKQLDRLSWPGITTNRERSRSFQRFYRKARSGDRRLARYHSGIIARQRLV